MYFQFFCVNIPFNSSIDAFRRLQLVKDFSEILQKTTSSDKNIDTFFEGNEYGKLRKTVGCVQVSWWFSDCGFPEYYFIL